MIIKESVRGIVEYILKQGSLDDRFSSRGRALEGTRVHGKLQKENQNIYENYNKEVKLSWSFFKEDIELIIEGRVDGIIIENNLVIIEEIKSTYKNLIYIEEDYNKVHWAQVKFYGYIYCMMNNLDNLNLRLSYYNISNDEVKSFEKNFKLENLEDEIYEIVEKYMDFIQFKIDIKNKRDLSISRIKFPFANYRKGQRELAVTCYNSIREKGVLFAQAPTGIGKTISTIFPSLKAIEKGLGERIIYLTSKTITRVVAEEAFQKLVSKGLSIKVVSLTAKEKMCLNDEVKCNPEECKYALNYFSKVDNVIKTVFPEKDIYTRMDILNYGKRFEVCPFELSLDFASFCDAIICDYNYAFNPRVRLKRIFEEVNYKNIILIDEAHNLVNRARDMYSGEISKSTVLKVARLLKGKVPNLYKACNNINKELIEIRRELEEVEKNHIYKNVRYRDLIKTMRIFISEADEYLVKGKNTDGYNEVLDFYHEINTFISLNELYTEKYVTILKKDRNEFLVKIFCVDPSESLKEIVNTAQSTILFSATLTPLKYYIDLLGGDEKSFRVKFNSPFNEENLKTSLYPISIRYADREKNIDKVCIMIKEFIDKEDGNYLVFLPSYNYLKKVYKRYTELYSENNTILQNELMTENEKQEFLDKFQIRNKIIGFSVVGGMFSEGIDLPGDKLIGAIIVGVGFPMISIENNIVKEYFGEQGFDYAYTYPGINKVLQSAGRVIRTEEDKGRVLLIDDRYLNRKYKEILPNKWNINIINKK